MRSICVIIALIAVLGFIADEPGHAQHQSSASLLELKLAAERLRVGSVAPASSVNASQSSSLQTQDQRVVMLEELITEAFTGARAFDESSDIHKLDCCRRDLLRVRNLGGLFQARIGHDHYAHVGINRAERIILRRRFVCACDRIEKR